MARRIIGAAFVSLDGVIQAPGGPSEDPTGGFPYGGWLFPLGDEVIEEQIGGLFSAPFDLLLGRRTYDIFAAYWPYAAEDHPIRIAFDAATKHVLTRSDAPLEWQNSQALSGIDAVAGLRSGEGPDIVIQGSSTLYPQLVAAGLLDRLVLMIAPIVLGQGKRLFEQPGGALTWQLAGHQVGSKGCIAATYVPRGPITVGSFGEQGPNPRELQRQQRMKEGTW